MNPAVRPEIPKEADLALRNYSELLRKLLFYRGIASADEAEKFLNPRYEDAHDPFLMRGMREAVERVRSAISSGEKILIFSDYDSDGIPGAVILHDFFRKIGYANFANYIPHRILEGFGLNREAIEKFADDGVSLVITVDCGTANLAEAGLLKRKGISLIILDHHLPNISPEGAEILPEGAILLNHKQRQCGYPDKNLCASGIAFTFVRGFLETYAADFGVAEGWEKWLLDMAGIATVADMVPLRGENRILASYGLLVLRKTPRPGLRKLFSILKMDGRNVNEDDIGFMISPRINAASRMGVPEDAFRMLVERDEAEAEKYARHLDKINDERKGLVAAMVKEIKKRLEETDPDRSRKVLVMGNPDWKPSLLGLAANSLLDEHDGPVFLWGREEGKTLKGSVRSDGSVNIVEMMREAADCFEEFGGHAASGGFTVRFEKVAELGRALEAAYAKLAASGSAKKEIPADAALSIDDVSPRLADEIGRLAPFGMENPKPLFLFPRAEIAGVAVFGKTGGHLKLDFKKKNGERVSAIAFFARPEDFAAKLEKGEKIDLFAHVEKSFFRGRPEIRLRIADIA